MSRKPPWFAALFNFLQLPLSFCHNSHYSFPPPLLAPPRGGIMGRGFYIKGVIVSCGSYISCSHCSHSFLLVTSLVLYVHSAIINNNIEKPSKMLEGFFVSILLRVTSVQRPALFHIAYAVISRFINVI